MQHFTGFHFHNTKKLSNRPSYLLFFWRQLSLEKWGRKQLFTMWRWKTLDVLPDILSYKSNNSLSSSQANTQGPSISPFTTLHTVNPRTVLSSHLPKTSTKNSTLSILQQSPGLINSQAHVLYGLSVKELAAPASHLKWHQIGKEKGSLRPLDCRPHPAPSPHITLGEHFLKYFLINLD